MKPHTREEKPRGRGGKKAAGPKKGTLDEAKEIGEGSGKKKSLQKAEQFSEKKEGGGGEKGKTRGEGNKKKSLTPISKQ